jgi:hypothetical protein
MDIWIGCIKHLPSVKQKPSKEELQRANSSLPAAISSLL